MLVIVAVPVTVPALWGAKVTVTVRLEPAVIVSGKVRGVIEKPAPDRVTAETIKSAVPVLETVTAWLVLVPTVTLPKLRLLGDALTAGLPEVGFGDGCATPVPPHPVCRNGKTHKEANRSSRAARFRRFTCFLSECRQESAQMQARLWRIYPAPNGSARCELLQAK